MTQRYSSLLLAGLLLSAPLAHAQLSILTQFNPSNTGGTCGIAYNAPAGEIMVIGCSASVIDRYAEDGTFISSADVVGEGANDVDIDMTPADLAMNGTFIAQGQLLLVNGESGVAEIYAIDEVTNEVIDTLATGFGVSHVVGGSYHPQRGTFFLVQDKVPGGFQANRIAEIDAATGDTIHTFSTMPAFQVDYGDLDISPISGNLFVVSSDESGIAEFTPDGVFVTEHPLPSGVSSLSGIALDNDLEGAWVCSTSGVVFKLGNFPVGAFERTGSPILQLYPNPVFDVLTVRCDALDITGPLLIVNAAGKVVLRERIVGAYMTVDVTALTSGLYTVRSEANGVSQRFLKN